MTLTHVNKEISLHNLMKFLTYISLPYHVKIRRSGYAEIEIYITNNEVATEKCDYSLINGKVVFSSKGWAEDILALINSNMSVEDYMENHFSGLANIQLGCKSEVSMRTITPNHIDFSVVRDQKRYKIVWDRGHNQTYDITDNHRG